MKSKYLKNLLATMALLLQACATTYQGPGPNLTLKGAQADEEFNKFKLKEGFWNSGDGFMMGPEEKLYTSSSMQPIIQSVSSDASADLDKSRMYGYFQTGFLLVCFGIMISDISNNDQSKKQSTNLAILATAGASIGFGMISHSYSSSAAEKYNRDLRQKLSPSVSYKFSW